LRRRIAITPGHAEVLALTSDNDDEIAGFLERTRQWLFSTVREMERAAVTYRNGLIVDLPHWAGGQRPDRLAPHLRVADRARIGGGT
jgi:hypothetical protein